MFRGDRVRGSDRDVGWGVYAAAMEEVLIGAGISLEKVHHGDELAS
ncbi:MAG TPA: hypothetical protein VIM33_13585 [Gaiellaceae bacterium]|jgi:hypothetical protein